MKAEELMVGDLLIVNKDGLCIKKGSVVRVRGIDADNTFRFGELLGSATCRPLDNTQFDGGIWCDYLDPIPLTLEILEKNGFEKQGFDGWDYTFGTEADNGHVLWRTDYGIPHLMIESYSSKYGDFRSFGIQYVHELQHALKLCGINLEIKL